MYNNISRVKNINLPENLFSNLGELKPTYQTQKKPSIIEINDTKNNDIKMTNLSNKREYRKRIDNMYNELNNLIPIDNEIDNIIYFNNYIEKGIVVRPKVSSLKQFWTEYRLINNEKNTNREDGNNLANFDELFNKLSRRVEEINSYIDELKEMRTSIDISNNKLEEEKAKLEEERKQFITYKKEEEEKIEEEKANIKINYDRLQTIINDLDKKLNEIDN